MTEQRALKILLILPLLASGIAALFFYFVPEKYFGKVPGLEYVGGIFFLLYMSGVFGGIPYIIVCLGIIWWTRKYPMKRLKIALYLSPWLMIPLTFANVLIGGVVDRAAETGIWQSLINAISKIDSYEIEFISGCCLAFGYLYIALFFAILWFLKKGNLVSQDTQHLLHGSA